MTLEDPPRHWKIRHDTRRSATTLEDPPRHSKFRHDTGRSALTLEDPPRHSKTPVTLEDPPWHWKIRRDTRRSSVTLEDPPRHWKIRQDTGRSATTLEVPPRHWKIRHNTWRPAMTFEDPLWHSKIRRDTRGVLEAEGASSVALSRFSGGAMKDLAGRQSWRKSEGIPSWAEASESRLECSQPVGWGSMVDITVMRAGSRVKQGRCWGPGWGISTWFRHVAESAQLPGGPWRTPGHPRLPHPYVHCHLHSASLPRLVGTSPGLSGRVAVLGMWYPLGPRSLVDPHIFCSIFLFPVLLLIESLLPYYNRNSYGFS